LEKNHDSPAREQIFHMEGFVRRFCERTVRWPIDLVALDGPSVYRVGPLP
jgi:hypothetical protein